jgi:Flp pilus assembly protein TadG
MLKTKSVLSKFACNQRGVATIETVLLLPTLIFVFLFGAFEFWQILSASLRLDRATSQVSAAASRASVGITEGEITAMMRSAAVSAQPTQMLSTGRIMVSAVEGGPGGKVLWKRCMGSLTTFAGKVGNEGATADFAAANLSVPPVDSVVIISESQFQYPITLAPTTFPNVKINHISMAIGRDAVGNGVADIGTKSNC